MCVGGSHSLEAVRRGMVQEAYDDKIGLPDFENKNTGNTWDVLILKMFLLFI